MGRRGIEMAVDSINRAGGVRGKPLHIIFSDDEGNGARAAKIAADFVADKKVLGVVGHFNSGAMMSAAKIYDSHLAAVATTATSPDLTGISPWVFRVISSDSANGSDMARFAFESGFHRAAILYENDSYGRGLAQSFKQSYEGTIVSEDPISGSGAQDFEPYLAYFTREKPDIVFVAGIEASGTAVLEEARREGVSFAFMGGDGWTSVSDEPAAEGAYIGAPFSAVDPRPAAQTFVREFRAKYGLTPDGNAAMGYDATMLLAAAVEARGADRVGVREWLATLGSRSGFVGVTGTIKFGPDGDPVGKGFVMTRLHDGALVVQEQSS
jgi:branched-chain amino acid transport system substrate-binding protein